MSQHIQSGETLPKDLFDKMYKAKNFQSGMQCLRQVEFALFDFLAHCEFDPNQNQQTLQDLIKQVRKEVAVIIPPEFNRFENGFSHIFAVTGNFEMNGDFNMKKKRNLDDNF